MCLVVSRGCFQRGGKSKSPLFGVSLVPFCTSRKEHRPCGPQAADPRASSCHASPVRDAVRRELLRGLLLRPAALRCSPSAQALLPLLTTAQRFSPVTLRGLRDAVTAHRSAKNAAPPSAPPVFSSARFTVPLLPAAQRFSFVFLPFIDFSSVLV